MIHYDLRANVYGKEEFLAFSAEKLDVVLEQFKTFLLDVGFTEDTVDRIIIADDMEKVVHDSRYELAPKEIIVKAGQDE